jgi:hypothetical protein
MSTSVVDKWWTVKIWMKNLTKVLNEFLPLTQVSPYTIQIKTQILNLKKCLKLKYQYSILIIIPSCPGCFKWGHDVWPSATRWRKIEEKRRWACGLKGGDVEWKLPQEKLKKYSCYSCFWLENVYDIQKSVL